MTPPHTVFAPKPNPQTFKAALNRLATDADFRTKVTANPDVLTKQFHLSVKELHALRQAAVMSGVDMTAINRAKGDALRNMAGAAGGIAHDVDVSCCCCCCC